MAIPILAGLAAGIGNGIVTSTFGEVISPAKRSLQHGVNRTFPNELPDIGSLMGAFNRGLLDQTVMQFAAQRVGVALPGAPNKSYDWFNSVWHQVMRASLSVPHPGEILQAGIEGVITPDAELALLKRSGASIRHYNLIRSHYYSWMDNSHLFLARNRELITDIQFGTGLKRLGLFHDGLPDLYRKLRESIPGYGEFLQYVSRGLLDGNHTVAAGLFDGLPPELETICNAHGLHKVSDAFSGPVGNLNGATWAQLIWANHWSTLGVGTIVSMMQRFRPGRVAKFALDGLNLKEFDVQSAREWLYYNSIPPNMRDAVIAAGFRPLDRRSLFIGVLTGEVRRDETIDILKDSGSCTADAERFADIMDARVEWQNNAPIRVLERGLIARTFRSAEKAYTVGIMDRTRFTGALTDIGLSESASQGYADVIDADLLAQRVTSVLKALKRDYLNGSIDPIELVSLLAQSGISSDRVQQYAAEWGALRSLERRVAQTEKIISWLVQGIMPEAIAVQRLGNLGWTAPDVLAYVAEAALKIAKRDAAIEQAGFRNAKANAALLQRLQRQADSQNKSLQSELRRLTPVGRLIKWARQGSISDQYFENRLRSMGYPDNVIAEYWLEVTKDGPLPSVTKRSKSQHSEAVSNATGSQGAPISGPSQGEPQPSVVAPESEPIR